jgi:hypothetical protein
MARGVYLRKLTPLPERFWAKVDRRGPDDCWEWTGTKTRKGYGQIRVAGHNMQAHRVSYELNVGPITAGLFACHRCDNPPCVNPGHLFLGTAADNSSDMVARGRTRAGGYFAKGSARSNAKLTEHDVITILERLARGDSHSTLGRRFGIAPSLISGIATGKRWRHVPRPLGVS